MPVFYGVSGFLFGLLLPSGAGLYFCLVNQLDFAKFFLKVLFFWLFVNQFLCPVLSVVGRALSPSLWSIFYTVYPLALVFPKSNLLVKLDHFTSVLINYHTLQILKGKLEKACLASRRLLSKFYHKLEKLTTF